MSVGLTKIRNLCISYRCNRNTRIGAGVTFYVRDGINAASRQDLYSNSLETFQILYNFSVHIYIYKYNNFKYCTIYRINRL
jgi:hypothetical protein